MEHPIVRIRPRPLTVLLGMALLLGGCGYNNRSDAFLIPYRRGHLEEAVAEVNRVARRNRGGNDEVLFRLEQGTILHTVGQYTQSNRAFDRADLLIRQHEQRADVSIADETGALLTNLTAFRYRGSPYERIMANTYKALNFLHLGDVASARVELNRAYEAQDLAVRSNAERIAKQRKNLSSRYDDSRTAARIDVDASRRNPAFQRAITETYQPLDGLVAYANYANPFTEFLQGLFHVYAASGSSDVEQGLMAFERVAGMAPANPYAAEDVRLAQQIAEGASRPARTYVIFESGLAPRREQVRINLPLLLVNDEVDYFGLAFPMLRMNPYRVRSLRVAHGGRVSGTSRLASMDAIVNQSFRNEMPAVITRTLIASAAKAAAQHAGKQTARDVGGLGGVLIEAGGLAYQLGMNQADLRTWRTLPKEFGYCAFPTPDSASITLGMPGDSPAGVKLDPGGINVVCVRSIQPGQPPLISQFTLHPEGENRRPKPRIVDSAEDEDTDEPAGATASPAVAR